MSQEISSPGKIVAATKFPRISGRSNLTERPYFLGNIAAPGKFCRFSVNITCALLVSVTTDKMNQEQYDVLLSYLRTAKLPSTLTKNEKDSLRRKSKSFLVKNGLLYHRNRKSDVDQQV